MIRETHEQDIEDIIEMRQKSAKDFPNEWLEVPRAKQLVKDLIEYPKRNIHHLVAKEGENVVGEIIWNESRPPDAWLDFLLVHPDYRQRGIGTLLLKTTVSRLSKRGFCILAAGTWPENDKAIIVYEKNGFKLLAPEAALLVNFFGVPFISNFFAEHPKLGEAELEEAATVGSVKCSSVSWEDRETSDSLTLYFKRIDRTSNIRFKNRSALIALESDMRGSKMKFRLTAKDWATCVGQPTKIGAIVEGAHFSIERVFFECASKESSLTIDTEELRTHTHPSSYESAANITVMKAGTYVIIARTCAGNQPVSLWNSIDVLKQIDLNVHPRILSLSPGQEKEVYVQLKNRSDSAARTEIGLEAEDIVALQCLPKRRMDFLGKHDAANCRLRLRAREDSPRRDYRLKVFASSKGEIIDEKPISLRVVSPEQVIALVICGGEEDVEGWDRRLDRFLCSQNEVAMDLLRPCSWGSPEFDAGTLRNNYHVVMIRRLSRGAADFSIKLLEVLEEYVGGGGGFVMGEGWRGCQNLGENGQERFYYTPVEGILPVMTFDAYGAQNTPAEIECLEPKHPIMEGINWKTCPRLRGYARVAGVRPSADVLAVDRITGDPLIVTWEYKKGRAMSFLSDFSGVWGQFFKNWRHYDSFLTNMMLWLAKKV